VTKAIPTFYALAGEQDVLRLEVQVGNGAVVQELQRLEHLPHAVAALRLRQALLVVQDRLQLATSGPAKRIIFDFNIEIAH